MNLKGSNRVQGVIWSNEKKGKVMQSYYSLKIKRKLFLKRKRQNSLIMKFREVIQQN